MEEQPGLIDGLSRYWRVMLIVAAIMGAVALIALRRSIPADSTDDAGPPTNAIAPTGSMSPALGAREEKTDSSTAARSDNPAASVMSQAVAVEARPAIALKGQGKWDEAEKLIKQIQRQFPREAAGEREYLTRAYAEVRYKKAEREWRLGQYYDRRGAYGAARFYYNILVKDFAETPFAEQAKSRMSEVADKPAVPPQRFQWLVDAFPKESNEKPLLATADPGKKRR